LLEDPYLSIHTPITENKCALKDMSIIAELIYKFHNNGMLFKNKKNKLMFYAGA
jgi:hypothetical protein